MPLTPDGEKPEFLSDFDLEYIPHTSTANESSITPASELQIPLNSEEQPLLLRMLTPWKLLIVLVICLLIHGAMNIDSREDIEKSESVERVMKAISSTKEAYILQTSQLKTSVRNSKKSFTSKVIQNSSIKAINRAIEDCRKSTAVKSPRANDWRRLGIVLAEFNQPKVLENFRKASAVSEIVPSSSASRLLSKRTAGSMLGGIQHPISTEQENRLWDSIYGTNPPPTSQIALFSNQLKQFKLGWFEKLALHRLYIRAGMQQAAAQVQTAAMNAADAESKISTLDTSIAFLGVLLWFGIGIRKLLAKKNESIRNLPAIYHKSPLIDYQTGMIAFLLYFLVMTFIGLPLLVFKPLFLTMSSAQILRTELALQLLLYVPILGLTLAGLRKVIEIKTGKNITWQKLFYELGLRCNNFSEEVAEGVRGFILILPVFFLSAAISQLLFSKYHTPINPAQLEILGVQNIWDKITLVLVVAAAGPIVEEVMFRGVLFQTLQNRFHIIPSMLISGAVFALVHPTLPAGFLPIWLLGSGFALVFTRRNSLIANIVMHCLHNGLIIAAGFAMMAQ